MTASLDKIKLPHIPDRHCYIGRHYTQDDLTVQNVDIKIAETRERQKGDS